MNKKHKLAQLLNPVTHTYTLVDVTYGKILKHHPKKNTPYKNVEIINKERHISQLPDK
jgi:hypothetical protein